MKLNKNNYFSLEANKYYMSVSQYKGFISCEGREMAKLNNKWTQEETDALLVGRYAHAWNEGVLDEFKKDNPQLFFLSGPKAGELKKRYEIADKVIDVIDNDELLRLSLSGEKEVIFTAELFGIPWKILIDSYAYDDHRFGDLKVLKSLYDKFWDKETSSYKNVFEYRGYFTQMAVYCEIERRANNRSFYFEPFLSVVTKEKIPDKCVVSFVSDEFPLEDFIDSELNIINSNIERIKKVKAGEILPKKCGICDFCRSTKKLKHTNHFTSFNLY